MPDELEPPSESDRSIAGDPDAIAAALGSDGSYPATVWDALARRRTPIEPPSDADLPDDLRRAMDDLWSGGPASPIEPPSDSELHEFYADPAHRAPQGPPRYRRDVSYGLGHRGRKSMLFERRSKRSFRRWLRQKIEQLGEKVDYG